jgi:hypothetical protein
MAQRAEDQLSRWQGRPVQSALLRIVAVAIPVAAGVGASVLFSAVVEFPETPWPVAAWWIAALALSTAVVVVVERQARRLLPLAALLRLSMVFPDQAPSRFGVALRAGTVRSLEEQRAEMERRGIENEPSRAAAQILELVGALAVHDRGTRGHAERVRAYADLVGVEMGLTADERDRLHWAALLHDVGKVAVPTHVLNKPGKPDEEEWAILRSHPEEGAKLAAPLRPWLGEWADTIEQHHERWDGRGYPKGLAGDEISRGARIVCVSDAFEVMTAARPYKKPMDVTTAREELMREAGAQFDPAVVRAFLAVSLRRQRWIAGPIAWLAGLPFLRNIPGGASAQVAALGGRVAATGAVVAAAVVPAATGPAAQLAAPSRPPAVVATSEVAPVPAPTVSAQTETPAPAPEPTLAVQPASFRPEAPAAVPAPARPARAAEPAPPAPEPAAPPPPPPSSPPPTPAPPPPDPTEPVPPTEPPPTELCLLAEITQPLAPALTEAVVEPLCMVIQGPV